MALLNFRWNQPSRSTNQQSLSYWGRRFRNGISDEHFIQGNHLILFIFLINCYVIQLLFHQLQMLAIPILLFISGLSCYLLFIQCKVDKLVFIDVAESSTKGGSTDLEIFSLPNVEVSRGTSHCTIK